MKKFYVSAVGGKPSDDDAVVVLGLYHYKSGTLRTFEMTVKQAAELHAQLAEVLTQAVQ